MSTTSPPHSEETLKRVASYLRTGRVLKTQELIMAEKRVEVFKGSFATKALLSPTYAKLRGVPKVGTAGEAGMLLQELLNTGLFLRVRQINNSRFLQPDMTRSWADDALYAWIYEEGQLMTLILGGALVLAVLGCFMFPLWPVGLRHQASRLMNWAMYLIMGIIGVLIGLSIIRMIVYLITYFVAKPGIWIFPNLWADCGVLESFQPLWAWDTPAAAAPPASRKND